MKEFDDLVNIVKILRSKRGCPWDRAQKLKNYKKYLLEEVYELIDELDKAKFLSLKEEIGDIFLILVAIVNILEEKNKFNLKDVLKSITNKLINRHPHVFGKKILKTKEEVYQHWIQHKAKAKKRKTIGERLPFSAPSLLIAELFVKELNTLENHKRQPDVKKIKEKIDMFLEKNKKNLFYEILFDLVMLGYEKNIDIETGFRKFIIDKASKISYTNNAEQKKVNQG